eukprot:1730301-Ditylum_brightwellii.AAC.1
MSNDGSSYENDDTSVMDGETNDEADTESDGEEEINMMGPGWKWDRCQDIADNENTPGPDAVDPYNGPHGFRPGIASSFTTI